ncbi:MAG: hypothetical protein RL091_2456 [Verrucomicrobiota bacterium]
MHTPSRTSCKTTSFRRWLNRRALACFLFMCVGLAPGQAADQSGYAQWDETSLVLDNGVTRRVVGLKPDGISTAQLTLAGFAQDTMVAAGKSDEFSFSLVGGPALAGRRGWQVQGCEHQTDQHGGRGAAVRLISPAGLKVKVVYLLYPDLPVIRKHLLIENTGPADIGIENLDVEDLQLVDNDVHCHLFTNYGRRRVLGPYLGDWDDSLVNLHFFSNQFNRQTAAWGLAVGNEAPGVTKHFSAFRGAGNNLAVGLRHAGENYPFRKWLKPGEAWTSPATFVVPYADADPQVVLNGAVNDFVRKHLGIRLAQLHQKPSFVYNTWTPFRTDINEALILDLARSAAAMGFQEFIIDDGWQANRSTLPNEHPIGDWLINKERFPHGLKPVFDEIKRLGMKPGLWLSLGAASNDSAVLAEHPEWFVRDAAGRPANLHGQHGHNRTRVTACLATGWADHFKHIVLKLVREHGLEYVKLDLALVTSAYLNDPLRSGCHATDHPGHRDHAESYYAIYAALWRLFDELHAEAPDLFIDCTFEAMGKLQLIDYAMCQHAEGNWLSNFEERAPLGSWRVRQMAWWRSPAMPATALVIGNQQLDDPEWEHSLKSLLGVFPIFLGDPRLVPAAQQQRIRQWADWQGAAQRKYDFSSYRRDPPGFGEPALGAWDGFMRVNTDTGAGGVVAVFRENARETTRRVFVPDLTPTREYAVKLAPEGRVLHTLTGRQLAEEGFPVTLERASDGAVFEIERR